jgi:hypothetical protein
MNEAGGLIRSARLSEGLAGVAVLHALVSGLIDDPAEVLICTETIAACSWERTGRCSDMLGISTRSRPALGTYASDQNQVRCERTDSRSEPRPNSPLPTSTATKDHGHPWA